MEKEAFVTPEVFGRYADQALPRYTSYPTTPHFHAGIGQQDYRAWLEAVPAERGLSLYFHVPFCRSMCWYCGCHTTITARDEPIARYLVALAGEVDRVTGHLPARMPAQHIHFGGGTPTVMTPWQFRRLVARIRTRFRVGADSEVAIEIDPRRLDPEMIEALAEGGINRASLGVQSFDPAVQRAINRVQTFDETALAVSRLRKAGIAGINLDLVYGLPHQDADSCRDTVATALRLEPDRLAVFGYAHVPQFKRHQRKIAEATLADGRGRHEQAQAIAGALAEAGYVQIGLDHFARPDDALAAAQAEGGLRRNFQGYTTDQSPILLGFGASAIGRLPQGYVQNAVLIGDYQQRIRSGGFATVKGGTFSTEDRLRAAVIERIMCDFEVDLDDVCGRFGARVESLTAEVPMLGQLMADGLVERRGERFAMPVAARPLVRVFAAAFDQYLGRGPMRHSRAA